MTRVLHITDAYGYTSGITSCLEHLMAGPGRSSLEISVWSPSTPAGNPWSLASRWLSPRYTREVGALLDDLKPDVLHAHSLSLRISPLPLLAARRRKVPVVMTAHDFTYVCPRKWMVLDDGSPCPSGFGARCLVSACPVSSGGRWNLPYQDLRWLKTALHRHWLREWVDLHICPSRVLADWMERSLPARRVLHIPNFVPVPPGDPSPPSRSPEILFMGRLSKEKGVDVLLRAMPAVREAFPDARLTMAGEGPERRGLERLAAGLGVEKTVRFAGLAKDEEVSALYRAAAVCVLPSLWMENCPVSVLEAMAHGRPVVGTDIGGIPELVEDGVTGLLVAPGDPGALASALMTLLGDGERLRSLGARARERHADRFTPRRHLERLSAAYSSLGP